MAFVPPPARAVLGLLVVIGLFLGACSDDSHPPPPDASIGDGPDGSPPRPDGTPRPDAQVPLPASVTPGGAGHAQVGAVLGASEVRAGRVTAPGQLLPGIKVTGRVGDFKIYNSKVAFIVTAARPVDGFGPYGGKLVDASRLDQAGVAAEGLLGEMLFTVGVHMLKPSSIGVVNDGSDGKPAVIRVIGEPAPFPMLASVLAGLAEPAAAWLVVEYQLAAGSDLLEIRWRFFNKTNKPLELLMLAVGITAGDGAQIFSDEAGYDIAKAQTRDYVGLIAPGVGYAFYSPEEMLTPILFKEGIWVLTAGGMTIPAAGTVERRYRVLLVDGDPEAVRRAIRVQRGEPEPAALSGVVRSGTAPLAGARVHVERDDATQTYVSMARSGPGGAYKLALGPGSYRVTAVADGRAIPAAVPLKIETAAVASDLQVQPGAHLDATVTDGKGPIPAKLIIKPKTPPAGLPATFGELSYPYGNLTRYSASGSAKVDLPAGEYTIIASRGFEYEIQQSLVTLAADETRTASFQLARSVSTPGYMCGDFHVHAMWSPDSNDLYDHKVSAMAAEGLEIPVITEHEYIADINPTVAKLGLQPWIRGMIGEELTTFTFGHFNPFPLTQDPGKPNNGAVPWYGKNPPTLFAEVHATWPGAVLQVNHPRGWSAGGYFSWAGYDPKTGTAKKGEDWSRLFDAIEVFNGSGWNANQGGTVLDWYSFLDRGFMVTATGNSDSHTTVWDNVGYPRNYVKLSTDEPANLSTAELAKAVREQRVLVSGGPFVSVAIGGKSMGDLVDAKAKSVTLSLSVQAPTWMAVDKLRVIVSGQTVHELALDATTVDPQNPVLRFKKELTVAVDHDSWLIVVVTGSGTLDPVVKGSQPFALTNPIYLDVDGNGVYDPPKSF